jgi:Fe-S cluster assembly iron-binding protein IscA
MLVLTDNATAVIHAIVDRQDTTNSGGLRIARRPDAADTLAVTTVDGPAAGDQVLEDRGAVVFIDPEAASMLDNKILDASVDTQGQVEFLLTAQ